MEINTYPFFYFIFINYYFMMINQSLNMRNNDRKIPVENNAIK